MTPLRLMCVLAHPDDESLGTGGTLARYAAEGVECVVRDVTDGHLSILLDTATRTYGPVRLALAGAHQAANAFVAVALLEILDDLGFHVDRVAVETGLSAARWPGRIDRVTVAGGSAAALGRRSEHVGGTGGARPRALLDWIAGARRHRAIGARGLELAGAGAARRWPGGRVQRR